MLLLLLVTILNNAFLNWSADIVVTPKVNLNWTSQTFIIPPGALLKDLGANCRRYSKYYCLYAYETKVERNVVMTQFFGYGYGYYQHIMPSHEPGGVEQEEDAEDLAIEYDVNDFMEDEYLADNIRTHKSSLYVSCFEATRPMHRLHNNFIGVSGCCKYQCDNYFIHGYKRMFLSPSEYIDKLTDYSEENKTLNLIEAYFNSNCNRNIITKLGFGVGELVRINHPFGYEPQRFGYFYLLSSSDDSIAHVFPYDNPENQLTFWWFKHNIICRDQPWICYEHGKNKGNDASTSGLQRRNASERDERDEDQIAEQLLNKIGCNIC